jgi:NAD(P)-dependent dehydrogenase (short-subunit alcohol dehydrogenase family)
LSEKTARIHYQFRDFRVAITGGAGVLCAEIAFALAAAGARIALLDLDEERASQLAHRITKETNSTCISAGCDVLQQESISSAIQSVSDRWSGLDGLINGAGGNHPKATTNPEQRFFDLPQDAVRFVLDLNLLGTILPSQVAGSIMAQQGQGVILNISSMNALRPLTKIPAYSAAKAGVSNFTQWLAVHLAQGYSPGIRVNAIAPGFFLTPQNRFLLEEKETGELTPRGNAVISHTPMGRFGNPTDLVGASLWLLSDAAEFVTGVVLPIDGGFSAFSGV